MFRRIAVGAGVLALGLTGAWKGVVSEYFGRVDLETWASEHPTPPPPTVELGPHPLRLVSTRRIVPSEGLDPALAVQNANNNLDVVRHGGRVYLAWRSGSSHFAGEATVVHVASSEDEVTWRREATFHLGRDLREPRLLSLGDKLLLYVSRLGKSAFDFEPQGLSVSERSADGAWSKLADVGPPGAIAWRVKPHEGEALMVLYRGGENLYSFNGKPMTVELWRSPDGRAWRPFSPAGPVVLSGGGSETDLAFDAKGGFFAVVRNEAGDASGAGSKLCTGSSLSLDKWSCRTDPRKYDSPLVFEHAGEFYVAGRRNLTPDGRYAVTESAGTVGIVRNELSYITTAKRCALWHWNAQEQRLGFVMDLPSRGDTCFPSRLETDDPRKLVIYDYSSDIEGPELPWAAGQRLPTYVYRHELRFD